MTRRLRDWLGRKWFRQQSPLLAQAYQVTFATAEGRLVLQHWLDEVYCRVCHSQDPIALAMHNGRRSVIHEILEAIDMAEQPDKYMTTAMEDPWQVNPTSR
jgi:hypothetical protein